MTKCLPTCLQDLHIRFNPYKKINMPVLDLRCIYQTEDIQYVFSGYIDELEETEINEMVYEMFHNHSFDYLNKIIGDYILAVWNDNKLMVINSPASQKDFFWKLDSEKTMGVSTNHSDIVKIFNFDWSAMPLICYGETVNIYHEIHAVQKNNVLIYDNGEALVSPLYLKPRTVYSEKMTIDEWGEATYAVLKKAVKRQASRFKKPGLLLSGGVDSSAVARCLYDLNVDAVFYTWSSKEPSLDEAVFSKELAEKFNKQIELVAVDAPDFPLIPKTGATVFPFAHAVSSWWAETTLMAKEQGIDGLISGCRAEMLGTAFDFNNFKSLKDKLYILVHAHANALVPKKQEKDATCYQEDLFRKVDVLTGDAKNCLMAHLNNQTKMQNMIIQQYAYRLSMFKNSNLYHYAAFLDQDMLDIANQIPLKYKNTYYAGQGMNKFILRYSMKNKLPDRILRRCYSANLSYITQSNLLNHLKRNEFCLTPDSLLVKQGIVDFKMFEKVLKDEKLLRSNSSVISASLLIENWLQTLTE